MKKLAYVFVLGPHELEKKGLFLLRSIHKNTEAEKKDIFVFIEDSEREEISENAINEARDKATILDGSFPISEYPLSSAHEALYQASQESDVEYLVLLDTDTVVLDDLDIDLNQNKDLLLKPVDLGNRYGEKKSQKKSGKNYAPNTGLSIKIKLQSQLLTEKKYFHIITAAS